MNQAVHIPNDAIATIGLIFDDAIGIKIAAPVGGSVMSSDPSVVLVGLSADKTSIAVQAAPGVSSGTATVTYTDGTLTAQLEVTVVAPVPVSVSFNTAAVALAPATTPGNVTVTGPVVEAPAPVEAAPVETAPAAATPAAP